MGFRDARRGQQFSGLEGEDVVGLEGIHIECKRTEALSLYPAYEQADRDADPTDIPVVCHRRNRKEWLLIMRLDHMVVFALTILPLLGYTVEPPKR